MPKANGTTELAKRLGVTRQRAYQLLRYQLHLCVICSNDLGANRMYCDKHAELINARKRELAREKQQGRRPR